MDGGRGDGGEMGWMAATSLPPQPGVARGQLRLKTYEPPVSEAGMMLLRPKKKTKEKPQIRTGKPQAATAATGPTHARTRHKRAATAAEKGPTKQSITQAVLMST